MNTLTKIIGNITHYLYKNKDNGYSIAKIVIEDGKEVIITGYFPELAKDVSYEFEVEEVSHPKYGVQWKVNSFSKAEVQNKEGLIAYLSSDLFTGIGPMRARKIVDTLGDDAILKILEDKNVLKDIGLNPLQIERFYQQLFQNQVVEETLVKLYGYGLTSRMAMKLFNKYGSETLKVLKSNPYKLIDDIEGVGFVRADEIAKLFDISETDERRIEAAVLFACHTYSFKKGDTYITEKQLIQSSKMVLGQIQEDYIINAVVRLVDQERLIKNNQRYYIKFIYEAEQAISKDIKRLIHRDQTSIIKQELSTYIGIVEKILQITYTEKQVEAIKEALNSPISVITGGPGTGKTTVIRGIIEVYARLYDLDLASDKIQEHIALIAPTGRAARRMKDVMGIPAQTIHRQLGYNYEGHFLYDDVYQLPQKMIVIDESSMIDVFLANQLFKSISNESIVIIVGDKDQLPSVGPGHVLGDILSSQIVTVIELNEIHRQAKNSGIIRLATAINQQSLNKEVLTDSNDLTFISSNQDDMMDLIIDAVDQALDANYDLIEDVQILVPMYRGPIGIDQINKVMQKHFHPKTAKNIQYADKTYYVGDKVIQLVNSPERGIMNGDIGYIHDMTKTATNDDLIAVMFDGNKVFYHKPDLEELNLAYAISIHKSQGSEYAIVIMPLANGYQVMLRKELLYTGITRTKSHLSLIGTLGLIEKSANILNEKRQTALKSFLVEEDIQLETNEDELSPFDFLDE